MTVSMKPGRLSLVMIRLPIGPYLTSSREAFTSKQSVHQRTHTSAQIRAGMIVIPHPSAWPLAMGRPLGWAEPCALGGAVC